jgi:dienelactone hydrolase
MDADELMVAEGDLDVAREVVEAVESAELLLYPGHQHLFADRSLPSYDESAATLLQRRVVSFLNNIS